MKTLSDSKRIVVSLTNGKALDLVRLLRQEKQIDACNIHRGRGRSSAVPQTVSYGEYIETEVMSVIVDAARADEIFEFIFFEANLNQPHGGFLYQVSLNQSTEFVLPDIAEEE